MRYKYTLLPFVLLAACQGKTETPQTIEPIETDHVISVNMTYDRDIDFSVSHIAVVPNNVAPWAGSLFVIDDASTLRRGDIDRGDFKTVAPNITGLAPLARKNSAGIIITKSNDGTVKGFFEINDYGDFREIPFAKPAPIITSFCAADSLGPQRVYAQDGKNIMALELISPTDNGYITSKNIDGLTPHHKSCVLSIGTTDIKSFDIPSAATAARTIDAETIVFTTDDSLTSPRLFMQRNDIITAIDITGGLSTTAPSRIDSFYIIPNSLGGALRDGALILADNESQRLIYVSLGFLKTRMDDVAPTQTNQ